MQVRFTGERYYSPCDLDWLRYPWVNLKNEREKT